MRPQLLNALFAPVEKLPGIGPKLALGLTRLFRGNDSTEIARVGDLLFHLPASLIDRRNQPCVAEAKEGEIATIKVIIDQHFPPPRGNKRAPYRVQVHDPSGEMSLVYFHGQGSWLEKQMPVGETRYISGTVEWFNDRPNMVHPDYVVSEDKLAELPLVEPVYPLTAGISQKIISKAVRAAIQTAPDMPEWINADVLTRHKWPDFKNSLQRLHEPRDILDIPDATGLLTK